jgi:WD40 repeat protein
MVNQVVFSPDGKLLAATRNVSTIGFWDVERRCEVGNLKYAYGPRLFSGFGVLRGGSG